jgi:hypothetical protein
MDDSERRPAVAREEGVKGARKPYQAPQILSREPLEAMAESCPSSSQGGNGKGSLIQPGCTKISS